MPVYMRLTATVVVAVTKCGYDSDVNVTVCITASENVAGYSIINITMIVILTITIGTIVSI